MDFKQIDAPSSNVENPNKMSGEFSTLESSAIKKIVRENWESKLKVKGLDACDLDAHINFMKQLGLADYEVVCMGNIATHSKHMTKNEILAYTKFVEALGIGYQARFGPGFSSLLIAGVTLVSKDLRTIRGHFETFLGHISKNAGVYRGRMDREAKVIAYLNLQLLKKNSGFFRFIRKQEIEKLRKQIEAKKSRMGRFQKQKAKYDSISTSIKAKVSMGQARKQ